ncbi:response regulator [uncultured Zoogloea sp.]|uniref:response regulator n=1 Tax=uncultured Zoogloea sp. TaxID=160237 RepID=UPI00262B3C8A|nr:response regulator [uncultured Zoogloea sp.]
MRILLVEDDRLLGDGVKAGLCGAGFAVDWVRDGEAALAAVAAESFAAIVLDLGLPRRDGLSVLSALRAAGNPVPVLVLTARDQVADKVRCLDLGADDYVVKPFDLDELAARLRALARRARGRAEASLRHGEVVLDPAARSVTLRGEPVVLTGREFDLLQMLLEAAGRVLTRRGLDEQLYAWGEAVGSNALEVHIHHLRKKLGADLIRTVRGVGYMVDEAPR